MISPSEIFLSNEASPASNTSLLMESNPLLDEKNEIFDVFENPHLIKTVSPKELSTEKPKRGLGGVPSKALKKKMKFNDSRFSEYESARKLDALYHDPLEELVKLHARLKASLKYMEQCRDGIRDGKFSLIWYNDTLSQIGRVNADLIRYRYARVSETTIVKQENLPVFQVVTTTPETYDSVVDVEFDEVSNEAPE